MQALLFYLGYGLVWMLSLLPLPLLYLFSPIIYFILYHILGYRKFIVRTNLKRSFPKKTKSEIIRIERKFYWYLSELIIENIKWLTMSEREAQRRIHYLNPEILIELHGQNKQVIVVAGHYGNWEWLSALARATPYHTLSVYKPIRNHRLDALMKRIRERHGTSMIPMKAVLKTMQDNIQQRKLTLSCFISDQSPVWEETQYWTQFLNQETAVYLGIEKLARKTSQPVVFYHMQRIRRGYYAVEVVPLIADGSKTAVYEITERHIQVLERIIRQQPEYWLWTHRRWKLTDRKKREKRKNIKMNIA